MTRDISVFDIIGPIMVGPSSSHTAGAVRMGQVARAILGGRPAEAVIALHGSFAHTGREHDTDRGMETAQGGLAATPTGRRLAQMVWQDREHGRKYTP